MGNLYTTNDGGILTDLTAGDLILDLTNGIITKPDGSTETMNTSLQTMGKTYARSFMVFCSDADSVIHVGNALTISDHQLTHVIHSYDFNQIRIVIPSNSTPDENQVAFMVSDDEYLNYEPHDYWHDRGIVSGTSTDVDTNYYTKHVGAYDDFYLTIHNTGGANSIDVVVYYSEDGTTYFAEQGYTTPVTVAHSSYNSFATSRKHHFYRVQIVSTSTGNHSTFKIYYNNVSVF
jgi:hypothetical protein